MPGGGRRRSRRGGRRSRARAVRAGRTRPAPARARRTRPAPLRRGARPRRPAARRAARWRAESRAARRRHARVAGATSLSYNTRMTDAEFLKALEDGTFPRDLMDHRAHLRLALLHRHDPQAGRDLLVKYVRQIGGMVRYNETLT